MPAFDLAEHPTTLSRFDVVGEHSEEVPHFVRHVALFKPDDGEVKHRDTVDVVHMGPPLDTDGQLAVDVAGRVPLTNDEMNTINTWIAKVEEEYKRGEAGVREQYRIDPPMEDVRDRRTGVRRYRRYSCAGFVLDAYSQVEVSLLAIDVDARPGVPGETIEAVYPGILNHLGRLNRSEIQDNGSWRIVVAGYVLRALDRSREDILEGPYVAKEGDELF